MSEVPHRLLDTVYILKHLISQPYLNYNPNPFRVFTRLPYSIYGEKIIEISESTWGDSLVSRSVYTSTCDTKLYTEYFTYTFLTG
jgi:hypothetical protein